jgi:hypothetical protein
MKLLGTKEIIQMEQSFGNIDIWTCFMTRRGAGIWTIHIKCYIRVINKESSKAEIY